ncbi:formyltransferase family protein [Desulfovibrio sp. JC010]|uniref:formyltransferase family protein n=1 Tax=Desulfovibrio sp. JC010 TaxID=2593641 RepID=UPI0013D2EEF6|nr:formyltransferase family protein [Desulfovibrio sp. JC010]NDV26710.1 hypothetical protein [Desulfovibrio sp. JC010]
MQKKYKVNLLGQGLNRHGWEPIKEILRQSGAECLMFNHHETLPAESDLVILLGYDRIVPKAQIKQPSRGTILFHSSDLPEGRGWAPIYNTIARGLPLTQTLLFAEEEIDSGDIIAKARYPLSGNETESEVRDIDDALTVFLLKNKISDILSGKIKAQKQDKNPFSWWDRRTPADSEVFVDDNTLRILDHVRALPEKAPAFVYIRGRKFFLRLEPEDNAYGVKSGLIELVAD